MIRIAIFITLAVVLILAYFSLPPLFLPSNDEAAKYIQMKSFYLTHWQRIDIDYPGVKIGLGPDDLNPHLLFLKRNNALYCVFSPLFTFISSFFYPFLGEKGTFILPLLSFFLSVIVFSEILRMVMGKGAFYYLLLSAFTIGSPVYLFSIAFFEHMTALFLVILSLYFIVAYFKRKESIFNLFMSAFILGSAVFFRTDILFLAAGFVFSLSWGLLKNRQWKRIIVVIAGVALPVVAFMGSSFFLYGNLLTLHVNYNLRTNFSIWRIVQALGFLGGLFSLYLLNKEKDRQRLRIFYDFLAAIWFAAILILLNPSPASSLFLAFPLAFMIFFNAGKIVEETFSLKVRLEHFIFVTIGVYITLISIFFYRNLDTSVRFLLAAVPLSIIFIGSQWKEMIRFRLLYVSIAVLIGLGCFSNWVKLTGSVLRFGYYNSERVKFLESNTKKDDVVIFQSNALMEHAGPLFFERIYIVSRRGGRDLKDILSVLRQKGIKYCYYWTMDYSFAQKFSDQSSVVLSSAEFSAKKLPRHYLVKIGL